MRRKIRTSSAGATIGFLVGAYPTPAEAFIVEELRGLEAMGLSLHVFSLRAQVDRHDDLVRSPVSDVRARRLDVLRAHLTLFARGPRQYARTALFALRRADRSAWREFAQAGVLARMLTDAGISHLHAHFASEPGGVAEIAARMAAISYSISAHAKDLRLSSPDALRRKLDAARFAVTCTEYDRRRLAAIAGPRSRIFTMYHGVDVERFACGDRSAARPPLILAVGALRPRKGLPILVEAARLLRDVGKSARVRIIGDGDERARLAALIARHGLAPIVELCGELPQERVIESYREATVFAMPCRIAQDGDRDGIPSALLEAMAMELPVISTRIAGIPELITHGVNGLLVEPDDPLALAAAIRLLLEDALTRARLGAAARATVARRFCSTSNLVVVRDLLLEAVQRPTTAWATAAIEHG